MSTSTPTERYTFGNWILMKSPGIGSLNLLGTGIVMVGLIITMLTLLISNLQSALVVAAVVAVLFAVVGTPVGHRMVRRLGFARAKLNGEHQFRSGVFSSGPEGRGRLPGMLGKTTLLDKRDALGHDTFGVIKARAKTSSKGWLYTIVARCVPDGPYMEDQERLNTWVANMSTVLSSLGQETALVAAKAITDTAPDPGDRLAAGVKAMRGEDVPDVSQAVMDECVATYPDTASENVTYLELTFSGKGLNRKEDESAILSELARRVPGLLQQLQRAGGGSVGMVSAVELPEILHVAYDPAAQRWIEQSRISGHGSQIGWSEAGPVASEEHWDRLIHDSGVSVTYEMYSAPRSSVTELALGPLVSPHHDFTRKRVMLMYRPQGPDKSVTVSESDASKARYASGRKARVAAVDKLRMDATDKSRAEVAAGAVMVRFSLMVTITVTSHEDLDQATSTVDQLAGAVPIRLRRCTGSQAAGFATTLPAGFIPWEHTVVPDSVRSWT